MVIEPVYLLNAAQLELKSLMSRPASCRGLSQFASESGEAEFKRLAWVCHGLSADTTSDYYFAKIESIIIHLFTAKSDANMHLHIHRSKRNIELVIG